MNRDSSITKASSARESRHAGHCPPFCGLGAATAVAERLKAGGIRLQEQQQSERPHVMKNLHRT